MVSLEKWIFNLGHPKTLSRGKSFPVLMRHLRLLPHSHGELTNTLGVGLLESKGRITKEPSVHLLMLSRCPHLFSAAMVKCLILGNLQRKEVYLG